MVELGKIYTVFLQKEHKSIRKDWQAICKPPKLCFQFAHQKKIIIIICICTEWMCTEQMHTC